MRDNGNKRLVLGMIMALMMLAVVPMGAMRAHAMMIVDDQRNAGEITVDNSVFEIQADLLLSDKDVFNIQVTVKNNGADWEGKARVVESMDSSTAYYGGADPCAYDTELTLPQGSEKQFLVKIPKGSNNSECVNLRVMLWDRKSHLAADKMFARLLLDEMESLPVGVLSDEYASLTYLDMGGASIYYYSTNMPVKLVDMTKNKFTDTLDSLAILVIDEYNTDVLTDEEREALTSWIDNGGALIVGTGNAAEETLSGLGDVLPDVECLGVAQPENQENMYLDALDMSKLSIAALQGKSNRYNDLYGGLAASVGDGAVGVLPYSLAELGKTPGAITTATTQEQFVLNLLSDIGGYTMSRYNNVSGMASAYEKEYQVQRLLGLLGNVGNSLHFGLLKILIFLYVIFVGPVLYLILRVMKKRDLYWVMVPITAIAGIAIVFLAGRGFEIVTTRVYSVTTEDLSGRQNGKSYLYCYDASFEEWNLKLAEEYEYAGPLGDNYHYTDIKEMAEDYYYYHVQNTGGRIVMGMKPYSAFEDGYFRAGKSKYTQTGSLDISNLLFDWSGIEGVVTNNTDKNFAYFAVIANNTLYVYENLPAGGSCSLGETAPVYSSSSGFEWRSDYINGFTRDVYDEDIKGDLQLVSALGIGLSDAYPQNDLNAVVVCGVTKDGKPVIDDNCSEVSYSCFYTVQ